MHCPHCGFQLPRSAPDPGECPRCGIVFAKYEARMHEAGSASEASAPPARPAADPKPHDLASPRARSPAASPSRFASPRARSPAASPSQPAPFLCPSRASVRDACASLARLVRAGIGIAEALDSTGQSCHGKLGVALRDMGHRIIEGGELHGAAGVHPEIFRPVDVQTLRAASLQGEMGPAFEAIAAGLDRVIEVRRRLARKAAYPLSLFCFSVILTPITDLVTGKTSEYIWHVGLGLGVIALAVAFVVVGLPWIVRQPVIGDPLRRLGWRGPWPMRIYRDYVREHFYRTLGQALGGGLPLIEAVRTAAAVTADPTTMARAHAVVSDIATGAGLTTSLISHGIAARADQVVLIAAERAGDLEPSLEGLATRCADRVAHGIDGLIAAVGVLMTLIVFAWIAMSVIDAYQAIAGKTSQTIKGLMKGIERPLRP